VKTLVPIALTTLAATLAAPATPAAPVVAAARGDAAGLIGELTACKAVADNTARLACYDAATAKLAEATAKGEVKIIDREEIRQTRRSLFGFELPKIALFKGDDSAADTPSEIDTTLKAVGPSEYGKFTLTMADGAVWRTTEPLPRDPRVGMAVHIKRGALGNYFIRVGEMRGVPAQRIR